MSDYLKSEVEQAVEALTDLAKNSKDDDTRLRAAEAILSHARLSKPKENPSND